MANFSPRSMLKIAREKCGGKRFAFTTQAVHMPKFIFQPGLKLSSCNRKRLLKRFVLEAELKSQPG